MILTCSRCKKEKPETDFYKGTTKKNGFRSECKMCSSIYGKVSYRANIDTIKDYRETNKAQIKAKRKTRYEANRKKACADRKAFRLKYPEKNRGYERKYRALKRRNNHEPYTDADIFERDGWRCQLCGRKINRRLKFPNPYSKSIDHIIPISKGGSDSPINVQAAHLRCNMSKNAGNGGQLRLMG